MGDVHASGNPHYLLDPVNGLRAADLIRKRLGELRPQAASEFDRNFATFRQELCEAMVGAPLAGKYDAVKLATLFSAGKLLPFLAKQGDEGTLAGWLGTMSPYLGAKIVDDHNVWPYFARRFGIVIAGHLEPRPGVPPSTSHLSALVAQMKADHVAVLIASPYYDPHHARFVAENTGARIATLATLVGGMPGTEDYLRMIDYDVRTLARALAG